MSKNLWFHQYHHRPQLQTEAAHKILKMAYSGAPAPAKRAWDRALYSWNMVNLFSFGCHVIDRAYASTDCTGGVGETIKRKGGVSQACLGKSTSLI